MKVSLFALVKFGQKEYMQMLLDNGKIYMNHISEFVKIEDGKLRGDEYEALIKAEIISNLEISVDGNVIGKADIGKLFIKSDLPIGNIYSMYYLSELHYSNQSKIDERCKEFGDSCLIILNVAEFIKRFEAAARKLEREFMYSPVEYENMETYSGRWSLFKKPIDYKYQNEFRFLIKQEKFVGPVILEIGPLKDIAVMIESASINKLKFERCQRATGIDL